MSENILPTIPGDYIAQAASTLPDAESAPDERQQVTISIPGIDGVDGSCLRITFRAVGSFWVAEHAELV